MWNEMYQKGYDNAVRSFAYIPDFKNKKEKKEFERGLKDGYKTIKKKKNMIICSICKKEFNDFEEFCDHV